MVISRSRPGTGSVGTWTLTIIWLLTAAITIAGVIESMPETIGPIDVVTGILIFTLLAGMAGLGVLIVERSGNVIGWLFCVGGLIFGYQLWATYREVSLIEEWLVTSVLYLITFLLVPLVILLFPDGRLLPESGGRCGGSWQEV